MNLLLAMILSASPVVSQDNGEVTKNTHLSCNCPGHDVHEEGEVAEGSQGKEATEQDPAVIACSECDRGGK